MKQILQSIARDDLEVVTPWHHPNVRPAHVGEYETRIHCNDADSIPILRAYWNGALWLSTNTGQVLCVQELQWRGLVHPPTQPEQPS